MPAKTTSGTPKRSIKLRNVKRGCWFFPFPVTAEVAAIARGDGKGKGPDGEPVAAPIVGLKVEQGTRRIRKGGEIEIIDTAICTLALGEAEAKVQFGDLTPELVVPGEVWAALFADEVQGQTIRALIDRGEIAWSPEVGAPAATV